MQASYSFTEKELITKLKQFKTQIIKDDTRTISDTKLLELFINQKINKKKLVKKKPIVLTHWRFHNISYFINESNNAVYSFQTEERIGVKKYDPDKELTYIDFD